MDGADRQIDRESGAAAGLTLGRDEAPILLDDAVDGRQTQPGPLADVLGREERLEDVRAGGLIHALAVVAHREHDIVARLNAGALGAIAGVQGSLTGLDGNLPALPARAALRARAALPACAALRALRANGITGIDDEVGQKLVDLGRVEPDGIEFQSRLPEQIDILTDQAAKHLECASDGIVEIEHLGGDRLTARKRQELTGEIGRAHGGPANLLEFAAQ